MSAPAPQIEHTSYCKKCGYDLYGLDSHKCPKCGQWFDPNIPSSYEPQPHSFWRSFDKIISKIYGFFLVFGVLFLAVILILPGINRIAMKISRPSPGIINAQNVRYLAQACSAYAYEKIQGIYPEDLGVLIKEKMVPAKKFKNPLSNTPEPPSNLTIEQLADWINTHSDYAYIRPGPNESTDKPEIMIIEKFRENATEGINVGFPDNHVEYRSPSELVDELLKMLRRRTVSATTQPNFTQLIGK